MVRSPRCARNRAQPGSAAGYPSRGAGGGRNQPHLRPRKKKKGWEVNGGGAGGGGQEPQVSGENSTEGGGESLLQFPPATPPPQNYLEITSKVLGTYDTPPLTRGQSPFSRRPGAALREEEGPPRAPLSSLPPDPAPATEVTGVTAGRRAAWGCRTRGRGGTSASERAECPPADPRVYI